MPPRYTPRTESLTAGAVSPKKITAIILAVIFCLDPLSSALAAVAPITASSPTTDTATVTTVAPVADTSGTVDPVLSADQPTADPTIAPSQVTPILLVAPSNGATTIGIDQTKNPLTSKQTLPNIDAMSGAMTFSYPLTLPPGRGDMSPSVSLDYNSQANTRGGFLGTGWSLSLPSIDLSLKGGTNATYSRAPFVSSLSGELVQTSATGYQARAERGDFIQYAYNADIWVATMKNGTTYTFGSSDTARQRNGSRIAKWMLTEMKDPDGNSVTFAYEKDGEQVYPTTITYTNITSGGVVVTPGLSSIVFTYEQRPDVVTSYRTGFLVTTYRRLKTVEIRTQNVTRHRYTLAYASGGNTVTSLLASIQETGINPDTTTLQLPATSFSYQTHTAGWQKNADLTKWQNPIAAVLGGSGQYQNAEYLDINGDGLIDLLYSQYNWQANNGSGGNDCDGGFGAGVPHYLNYVFLNTGSGWQQDPAWQFPMPLKDCHEKDVGARFIDVNGDGLLDQIANGPKKWEQDPRQGSYSSWQYVWLNTGHGWSWDQSRAVVFPITGGVTAWNPNGDSSVRFADLNGDGLTDVIQSDGRQCMSASVRVWLNTGTSWVETTTWNQIPAFSPYWTCDGYATIIPSVQFADVNGDGLADLVSEAIYQHADYPQMTSPVVYINTGSGWASDNAWVAPVSFSKGAFAQNDVWMTSDSEFADVNGDGLVDLVNTRYVRTGAGRVPYNPATAPDLSSDVPVFPIDTAETHVYLNSGHGWLTTALTVPRMFIVPTYQNNGAEIWPSNGYYNRGARLLDANGDGVTDIVFSRVGYNVDGGPAYFGAGDADILTQVTAPAGGSTQVAYKGSAQYANAQGSLLNPLLSIPLALVDSVQTNDGLGHLSATQYSYSGGKPFFDGSYPLDTRFVGFANVIKTTSAKKENTAYRQDSIASIGLPVTSTVQDVNGNTYQSSRITYQDTALSSLGAPRTFVAPSQMLTQTFDGGVNHRDAAETVAYDAVGNVTQNVKLGEVTSDANGVVTDIGSDSRTTQTQYATWPNLAISSFPWRVTESALNAQTRITTTVYDAAASGTATKGHPTQTTASNDAGTLSITSSQSFDDVGNLISSIDPRFATTTYAYGTDRIYVATTTNALGHVTKAKYDLALGQPLAITNANNRTTSAVYDALGRLTALNGPDPSGVSVRLLDAAYTDTPNAISVRKQTYGSAAESTIDLTHADGLGRTIQTRHSMPDGTFAVQDTIYDTAGRVSKTSLPYTGIGEAKTAPTATPALLVTTTYDAMDRARTATNAVGVSKTDYDRWNVTLTDPLNRTKTLMNDAYGQLVGVTERNAGQAFTTSYGYDGAGNLILMTDANANIRRMTVDAFGRRTKVEDLHAPADLYFASTTYAYDANGNTTGEVKMDGTNLVKTYDLLNRPTTWKNSGLFIKSWTYDVGVDAKGHVTTASVPSAAVSRAYSYDAAGNTKTITTNSGSAYPETHTYDRAGKVLTNTLADGTVETFIYTAGRTMSASKTEKLATAAPVVTAMTYMPDGRVASVTYANGTKTTNTYDATRLYRLTNKKTIVTATNAVVQNIFYTYDAVGNVTKIEEKAPTVALRGVTYVYDDLDRLTSAIATSTGNVALYREVYSYDRIGNRMSATVTTATSTTDVTTYGYSGNLGSSYANPHAVTNATVRRNNIVTAIKTIVYTRTGNLNQVITQNSAYVIQPADSTAYFWSPAGTLTSSKIGYGTSTLLTTSYTYDPNDERIKKTEGATSTIYSTGDLETTLNASSTVVGTLKHISVEGATVATVKGSGVTAQTFMDHTDHLTGANLLTNSAAGIAEVVDYTPYGTIRLDQKNAGVSDTKKFAGQTFDDGMGLSYMHARYYSPALGRFISEDPAFWDFSFNLSDPQSLNSYAYARGNPIAYRDPDGRAFEAFYRFPVIGGPSMILDGFGKQSAALYSSVAHRSDSSWSGLNNALAAEGVRNSRDGALQTAIDATILLEGASLISGMGATARVARNAVDWDAKPFERGSQVDNVVGNNLGRTFPVADKMEWETGNLISNKSLDTTAKTYQSLSRLGSTIRRYGDDLATFAGKEYNGVSVRSKDILSRELKLVVPQNGMSAAQQEAIQGAGSYLKQKGVTLNVIKL